LSEAEFLENIRSNQGIIYKLVGLYACDAEEKKDLYQEVLLQTWKAWPTFRSEAKFSTWLYRICLNTILTQKRKVSKIDHSISVEETSSAVQNDYEITREIQELRNAIREFPETDRAIISMHLDGYDNAEIGELLGISNNHVAVKLHRIRQQLAYTLKQPG
jgi:RNA polymerase sigma factor (sigma-70 family)